MPKSDFAASGIRLHPLQPDLHLLRNIGQQETVSFVSAPRQAREGLVRVNPGDLIITNTVRTLRDVCKGRRMARRRRS